MADDNNQNKDSAPLQAVAVNNSDAIVSLRPEHDLRAREDRVTFAEFNSRHGSAKVDQKLKRLIPDDNLRMSYLKIRHDLTLKPDVLFPEICKMGLTEEYQQWTKRELAESQEAGNYMTKAMGRNMLLSTIAGAATGIGALFLHKKANISFIGKGKFSVLTGLVGAAATVFALATKSLKKSIEIDSRDLEQVDPFLMKLAQQYVDKKAQGFIEVDGVQYPPPPYNQVKATIVTEPQPEETTHFRKTEDTKRDKKESATVNER